jgi:hypothetical protein
MMRGVATVSEPARRAFIAIPARDIVALILGWKIGVLLVVYLAAWIVPMNTLLRDANAGVTPSNPTPFRVAMATWDAGNYITIAEEGYGPDRAVNAYAPAFPLAMRVMNVVTRDSVLSGLIVANAASGIAIYLLFLLVQKRLGTTAARNAVLLLIAFPTAFYLNLIYTEGLFLLLAVIFFYALQRGSYPLAAVAAFLIPLTRAVGIVIAVPFALYFALEVRRVAIASGRQEATRYATRNVGWVLAPLLGELAYMQYMWVTTGDALAASHAASHCICAWDPLNVFRPWRFLHHLFSTNLEISSYLDSYIDRIFFAVYVASLPVVYWRTDKTYFAFYVLMGGLPPLLGSFMSYTRYMLMAFPLFIAYGSLFKRESFALAAIVMPMIVLQAFLLTLQARFFWVA